MSVYNVFLQVTTLIYNMMAKINTLLFSTMSFGGSAFGFGHLCIGCFVFGILIKSVMSLPKSAPTYTTRARMENDIIRRREAARRTK